MIFIQSIKLKFMYPDVFALGVYEFNVMLDIMLASYIIFIVTSLWDTVVQIVAKKTCQKSNILFKEVDG